MRDRLVTHWTTAASREAQKAGAGEVDIEHFYLGLIALGGAAAGLLGRHGITLASARARAREVVGGEPGPAVPLRLGPRAQALVDRASAPDTYGLLVALLQEPSGAVRRLVHADGVVPQDLAPALREGADDPYAAEPVPVEPGLLAAPARAQRVRHFVSAPTALVADALADPALLAVWAYDPAHADETITHRRGSTTITLRAHHTRRREGDSEVIVWIHEARDAPHAGEPLLYDRFDVSPAPGGCLMVRTSGRRRLGITGRLMAPLHDSLAGWGMVHGTRAAALAIADRLT